MTFKCILDLEVCLRRGGAVKLWEKSDYGLNESINYEAVCRAAPGLARVC